MSSPTERERVGLPRDSVESRHATMGERVVAFLRGRHPTKTADNVAADTGIPANTVKTWLQRASAPDAEGYTALWVAYGPSFLLALTNRPPSWLDASYRQELAEQLKAEIEEREAKLARLRR